MEGVLLDPTETTVLINWPSTIVSTEQLIYVIKNARVRLDTLLLYVI